jgi:hypothetical protein
MIVLEINSSIYSGKKGEALENACVHWKMNTNNINRVLYLSTKISSNEKHHIYYSLACEIQVKLLIKNKHYRFLINAASYIIIMDNVDEYYLGCGVDECIDFFLLPKQE